MGVGHGGRLRGVIARRSGLDARLLADSPRRGVGLGWAREVADYPARGAIASAWIGVLPSSGEFDEDNARQGLDGCRCAGYIGEFGADGDGRGNNVLALGAETVVSVASEG